MTSIWYLVDSLVVCTHVRQDGKILPVTWMQISHATRTVTPDDNITSFPGFQFAEDLLSVLTKVKGRDGLQAANTSD